MKLNSAVIVAVLNVYMEFRDILSKSSIHQEPITRSEQLPYLAFITAFFQTSLFLDTV